MPWLVVAPLGSKSHDTGSWCSAHGIALLPQERGTGIRGRIPGCRFILSRGSRRRHGVLRDVHSGGGVHRHQPLHRRRHQRHVRGPARPQHESLDVITGLSLDAEGQ